MIQSSSIRFLLFILYSKDKTIKFIKIYSNFVNLLEKNLPNVRQSKNVPAHISVITNSQINIDKPSSSENLTSTPTSPNKTDNKGTDISQTNIKVTLIPKKTRKQSRNQQQQADNDYNQMNQLGQNQLTPQLVPIQTFSFFKWKINVDTLVRLFIIA